MSNNELFLEKYRELENLIKNKLTSEYRGNSPIYNYIRELYNSPYSNDHERGEKLDIFRELRNQMSHKNVDGIFEVSNDAIIFLENEIKIIQNPICAKNICIKFKDIHYATLDSSLNNVMKTMIKYGYSHIPVLNENKLIGVFSENTIFTIYNSDHNILNKENIILNDISYYLDINNHQTECFAFIHENYHVSKIIKRFKRRKENNKRLTIFFITKNGSVNSELIGMITPYDALIK